MSQQEIRDKIIPCAAGDHAKEQIYRDFADNLKTYCKLSYQLVAWLWLSKPMLEGKPEQEQEQELKSQFDQALKYQARTNNDSGSTKIKDFLTGTQPGSGLTIPEFYNKVTGVGVYPITQSILDPTKLKLKMEVQQTDSEGKLRFDSSKDEFIVTLHVLPSRFSNNITDDNIKTWVQDVSPGYLPDVSTNFPQDKYLGSF